MANFTVIVSTPSHREATTLTKEDVWGAYSKDGKCLSTGMVIARSRQICPIDGERIGYKGATILVPGRIADDAELLTDVLYWLEYVQGALCVDKTKATDTGALWIRTNYMCF